MKNLKHLFATMTLVLFATTAASAFAAGNADDSWEATLKKANGGHGTAQLQAGITYCEREPAAEHGKKTLKWLERATGPTATAQVRVQALQELGLFHLALFENFDHFDPAKDKPKPYCTGSVRSPENTRQAIKYLTTCAEDKNSAIAGGCNISLAHNFLYEKEYAIAYYWYATELTNYIPEASGDAAKMHKYSGPARDNDYNGPLLSIPHKNDSPAFKVNADTLFKNAKLAASKLTKEQIAEIDAQAYARYYKREKRAWLDTSSRASRADIND